jgi:steroid delta-isomerase-like uncharacterized protein
MGDDGKQVVLEYYERLNRGDLAGAEELFSDDCVVTVADASLDRREYFALLDSWLTGFPDLRNAVEEVVSEGPTVAVRTTWEGTHQAAFVGIPSSGRRVRYSSFSFSRVEGGRITERRLLANLFGVLQQLGDLSFQTPLQAEQPARDLAKDVSAAFRATPGAE